MQDKEVRLAVVLTGGVSLAIYMHGVTKELLKLVRASRSYHMRSDTEGAVPETYVDSCNGREVDTEAVYFDLLKSFAPELDLRVVIDVIAGASAGGVNGIMLARTLAHDLDMDPHRQMWLDHADVLQLIDEKSSARSWRKLYVWPMAGLLLGRQLHAMAPEKETREKLSAFLRSRWFHPPFSGERYTSWLLDASSAMERKAPLNGSLLPQGHALDLSVSVTDFHGHSNRIALHDPPEIEERDHRLVLKFAYLKSADGTVTSDFDAASAPGLVFAARATSCFPGAFPPASLGEIDALLARRGGAWPARARFVDGQLATFATEGKDIEAVRFIDGSVVNDKPFGAAVASIAGRAAHREVSRRIVFVEPNPLDTAMAQDLAEPGFFRTIISSLAEIPRNEPIHDDLARINAFNGNIRLIRQVVRQTAPVIDRFVDTILPPSGEEMRPTAGEIAEWRQQANDQAAREAGYAFHTYFRLKVLGVAKHLESLISALAWPGNGPEVPAHARLGFLAALSEYNVGEIDWRDRSGTDPVSEPEIQFLKSFDVDFRVRRIRFVIRRLNELYQVALATPEIRYQTDRLDDLKTTLYELLAEAKGRWTPDHYAPRIITGLRRKRRAGPGPDAFTPVFWRISDAMALDKLDGSIDEVFAIMVLNYIPQELRRDLFAAYIGFSFFDVMSYPMVQWEDLDEFEEILIDRISPADAVAIRKGGAREILQGTALRRFGGFFNRSYRENDYLWGRLNAADRLVDIIVSAVGESGVSHDLEVLSIKRRLFEAILDAEEPFLKADKNLIRTIREEIRTMSA